MGRLGAALPLLVGLVSGCLEPGDPVLEPLDTTAPELVEVQPPADSVIGVSPEFLVTFSEPLDERTVRAGISLRRDRTFVPVTIEVPPETGDPSGQLDPDWSVRITPESPLQPNSSYQLLLDPVLTDTEGNPLAGPDGGTGPVAIPYRTGM